ncbi:MAG: hypothetical protein ACTSVV_17275 [Promethearchaeota archaeon]
MRKDPNSIFSIILQTLNSLKNGKEYTINKISQMSKIHWTTTEKYLKLLDYIQNFVPNFKLLINDLGKIEGIKLLSKNKNYSKLDKKDKVIIKLYENDAFSSEKATKIESDLNSELESLKKFGLINEISNKFFLTKSGRLVALNLLTDLQKNIQNLDEIKIDIFQRHQEFILKKILDEIFLIKTLIQKEPTKKEEETNDSLDLTVMYCQI